METVGAWFWWQVIVPSWISLVSAPFVLTGYILLGRKRSEGWWFVIGSQAGLLAIALTDRQYGLVVVVVLIRQAYQNWRRWRREASAVPTAELRGVR